MWEPGQHFSVIAPTDYGKSYFVTRGLLPLRRNVLILDAKGVDDTLDRYGGRKVREMPGAMDRFLHGDEGGVRYRISPGLSRAARVFDDAVRKIWRGSGKMPGEGWTVYIDEARLFSDKLKLRSHLETLLIAGRSRGITVVASTQSPRFVPSEFYDQPRFVAIGNIRDRLALRRLAEIGGDTDMIMEVVPNLEWREFLIVAPRYAVRTTFKGGKG